MSAAWSNRLELFIQQKGNYVPVDVVEYQNIGNKADYCVFCNEAHDYHSTVNIMDTYLCGTCEDCSWEIKVMYESLEDDAISELTSEMENRIFNFNTYNELPKGVYNYSYKKADVCIFCDIPQTVYSGEFQKLYLKVGSTDRNHEQVVICPNCVKQVDDALIEFFDRSKKDTCYDCDVPYVVTREEFKSRSKQKSLGHHLCPVCWITRGMDPEDSRFKVNHCCDCDSEVILDLSIVPQESTQLTLDLKGVSTICKDCYVSRRDKELAKARDQFKFGPEQVEKYMRFHVPEKDKVTREGFVLLNFEEEISAIVLSTQSKKFKFELFKAIDGPEGFETLVIGKSSFNKLEDCALVASNVAYAYVEKYKLEKQKQQLGLWEND